jgi:hypothetical protein
LTNFIFKANILSRISAQKCHFILMRIILNTDMMILKNILVIFYFIKNSLGGLKNLTKKKKKKKFFAVFFCLKNAYIICRYE